jgi:catechol 2,3-dioxygenase-like lactoylglutathione lyase family enzyme
MAHACLAADSLRVLSLGIPMLDRIDHIALIVKDSSRTATLFKDLFGAAILVRKDVDGHEETYVRLGRTWFVLAQAEVVRPRSGDHIAFSVSMSTLLGTAEKPKRMNIEFFLARSDTALYFVDYDNHVFELDTTDLDRELAG